MIEAEGPVRLVSRPVEGPGVWIQVAVRAGSAHDPPGKEGLAWLTANLLREGGAGDRSPAQVDDAIYEMGARFDVVVDKELVTFRTHVLRGQLGEASALLGDMLTAPRLDPDVLARLVGEAADWLDRGLRSDEERLGLELLDTWLFEGHPYGHPVRGRTGVLSTITLGDVRDFIADRYVRPAVTLGVAGPVAVLPGGADDAAIDGLAGQLSKLPAHLYRDVTPRRPPTISGRELLVVQGDAPGTGIHFGQVTDLNPGDPDWPAMLLATAALGEHRQAHGRLYRALRTARGLNYGDYAYVGVYRQVGDSSLQQAGTLRLQNPFYVWLRPVDVSKGPFALRAALLMVDRWVEDGLSEGEFERTRASLASRVVLWGADPGLRLGWAVEAAAMGWPDPIDTLPDSIRNLTLDRVDRAIKAHVDPSRLRIVVVTSQPRDFLAAVTGEAVQAVGSEDGSNSNVEGAAGPTDAEIVGYDLGVTDAAVLSAEELFR